jgi:multidrug efflux pump subunit AcrA (membrane-fusion protein)
MFVQVVLRGKSHAPRVVIPRSAVRGGAVHVADGENRLRRRPVRKLFDQGAMSVVAEGLEPGDRVLVSDLVPAVEGMLLQVQVDEALSREIAALGSGT